MQEYLAFIDEVGKTVDEKYTYRFDFTYNTDMVWGDFFNVVPSISVPDLQVEDNIICKSTFVDFEKKLNLAKRNGCFSMQDCFEHIIALGFTELTENDTLYYNDEPLYFDFGEPIELVEDKIKSLGYSFYNTTEKEIGDETIIENLINKFEEETINENNIFAHQELITLSLKQEIKPQDLSTELYDKGYNRVDYIKEQGEYTTRGYIMDIFSYNHPNPIRISFFGNEIEKISFFDEDTQDELETLEKITIYEKTLFD